MSQICAKESQKVHPLVGVSSFMTGEKSILALNAFFSPHIDHFQLIMMVHSKSLKKQINQFPERALHILKIDTMFYSKDSSKTVR